MPAVTPAHLNPLPEQLRPHPAHARVVIDGWEAVTISPEGIPARMPLELLLRQLGGSRPNTAELILPEGVKAVISQGPITVCVWECPPRLHNLTWIANDSPAPFGPEAKYRQVRIALPYLIILAVFEVEGPGQLRLSQQSECFFRNAPLRSLDDELDFPALLNCYRGGPPGSNPLSWVCVGGLRPTPKMRSDNVNERVSASLDALRHYLLETAFNHSDGQGGKLSWFEASRSVDPRLNTVEAWEQASTKDPLFVLDVPWIKSGHTVRQVIERMSQNSRRPLLQRPGAATLARLIFNHQVRTPVVPFTPEI